TAGGVTIAAAEAARQRGVIRADDEVVTLVTGNGLKTPDAVRFGLDGGGSNRAGDPDTAPDRSNAGEPDRAAGPRRPGLAPVLPARYAAVEAWLER
ncbi:MAG: hypothetical protein ACRDGQ_11525, partial [Candidatus Limnocylindrales bacterium]